MPTRPRLSRRTLSLVAAATGVAAAGVALERRHLRTLARDPDYARLTEPLGGRPLTIVSADGTKLHAVDGTGVLLRPDAPTLGLPVYQGDAKPPQGPAGMRWGDPNVEAVARKLRK